MGKRDRKNSVETVTTNVQKEIAAMPIETVEVEIEETEINSNEETDTESVSASEVEDVLTAAPRKVYERRVPKGYFKDTADQRLNVIRDVLSSGNKPTSDIVRAIEDAGLTAPTNVSVEISQIKKDLGMGRHKAASADSSERNQAKIPTRLNTALHKFCDVVKFKGKDGNRIFNHDTFIVDFSGEVPAIRLMRA